MKHEKPLANSELKNPTGIIVGLFVTLLLVLKIVLAYYWRIDSDEPQHLHVLWSVAHGQLLYRDVFDNHAPLFCLLLVPLCRLFSERADLLLSMRFIVIPLYFAALWAVYLSGRALYSKIVGFWAMVFTALYPEFFLTSLEFRADDLWIVPWLLAVSLLLRKSLTTSNFFVVGILLGIALSISMKTTLLLSALSLAFLATESFLHKHEDNSLPSYIINGLALCAGLVLMPAMVILFFNSQGTLASLYYGVIQHNIVPGLGRWAHWKNGVVNILLASPLLIFGIYVVQRSSSDAGLRRRRSLIFLTFAFAMMGLHGFWPLITPQDFLPLIPLILIIISGEFIQVLGVRQQAKESRMQVSTLLSTLAGIELLWLIFTAVQVSALNTSSTAQDTNLLDEDISLLDETLRLTRPGETIMDTKGETVFRQRPFYYALEGVTLKRLALGMIKDTIAEDIVRSHTTVAQLDSIRYPRNGREFMNHNFIRVGKLRVAGHMLQTNKTGDIVFDIRIPSSYAVISSNAAAQGWLDGTLYIGPRKLSIGLHVFRSSDADAKQLAVIWAPAIARGFSPFTSDQSL